MTKKDFELIAKAIRRARAWQGSQKPMDILADIFADLLQETNTRFDRSKFLKTCSI